MKSHLIDRLTAPLAPQWTLKRQRARIALQQLDQFFGRHYEAASGGRRTKNWNKTNAEVNTLLGPSLATIRGNAKDLARNNPYVRSALNTIADDTVGWGIVPKAKDAAQAKLYRDLWEAWGETTACDADGRHDFYGLQKLVIRSVAKSGEVLIRRRIRRPDDGLPIPVQLQVLDADYLDTSKDSLGLPETGGRLIIQGVEFDAIGRRVAYWLFPNHPGSPRGSMTSVRVPAESVIHVFDAEDPGQVRGPSWLASVILRLREYDEFEDATLMKQKIAACLAVLTSDVDGTSTALGTADDTTDPGVDNLQPGAILNIQPGRTVNVIDPPRVNEFGDYSKTVLRASASGMGVGYEDMTGDFADMPFSAARMSRARRDPRIFDWRWRILIPQFCDPAWGWMSQVAVISGLAKEVATARWTPPPRPFVDPVEEGLAAQRNIRTGITSWEDTVRERGFDPDELLEEIAEGNKKRDKKGVILDSDPRVMTQAGQLQGSAVDKAKPATPAAVDDDDPDDDTRALRAHRRRWWPR